MLRLRYDTRIHVSAVSREDELEETPNPISHLAEPTKETLVEWFLERYEDPAQHVPFESAEGGYQYFENEPYDAREVLLDYFPNVKEEVIEQAVEELEWSSPVWVEKDRYG